VSKDGSVAYLLRRGTNRTIPADSNKPKTLEEVIGVYIGGPFGRRKDEVGHTVERYLEFFDLVK
jgi:hypothetical protein